MKLNLRQHPGSYNSKTSNLKMSRGFALAAAALLGVIMCGGCSGGNIPIGETGITITEVVLTDRFPPECEEGSVMCTMADEGYQYLVIWLDGGDSTDPLAALGSEVHITDSSGERHNPGGGLLTGRYFLAQRVPQDASGFTLYCADVEPIELGK